MPWLKEKTGITGRRWRTVLFGRKTVKKFLKTEVSQCSAHDLIMSTPFLGAHILEEQSFVVMEL